MPAPMVPAPRTATRSITGQFYRQCVECPRHGEGGSSHGPGRVAADRGAGGLSGVARGRGGRQGRHDEDAPAGPAPRGSIACSSTSSAPPTARHVLVLMPGTQGGAGDFTLTARYLERAVDDLQVWAIDRRSQALEDTTVFAQALDAARSASSRCSTTTSAGSQRRPPPTTSSSSTPTQSRVRARVGDEGRRSTTPARSSAAARHGGRSVILGGHSLGASLTAAYAAWDFHGRPGYKDVDGLVLIDGGLLGSFDAYDLAQAQAADRRPADLQPVPDLLGNGHPRGGRPVRRDRRDLRPPRADRGGAALQDVPVAAAGATSRRSRSPTARCSATTSTATRPRGARLFRSTAAAWRPAATRATGSTAASPRSPGSRRPSARSRSNSVEWFFPRAADDRHQRRRPDATTTSRSSSACGSSTPARSTCRSTRSRRPHRRRRPRGALRLHRSALATTARSRRWSTPSRRRATSTR